MGEVVFHATIIEIIWTLVTLIGVVANAWGCFDAIADKRWLKRVGLNGRRKTVARWHVMLNGALTWVQLAFLTAGVTACFSENTATGNTRVARIIVQLLFLSSEPVLVFIAVAAHRYRARLLAGRVLGATTYEDAVTP